MRGRTWSALRRRGHVVLGGALAVWLVWGVTVWAGQVRYVTDEARIPLRTGKGTQYKIIRMLKSGTPVEVLSVSEGYARVRTPGGKEGWMPERFLLDEPVARERLSQMERRVAALESETSTLRQQTEALQRLRSELESRNAALVEENRRQRSELETLREEAADPLRLSKENQALRARLAEQQARLESVENELRALRGDAERKWFLVGAGVALVSLFFGLIIPRIPWRKRRSWSEY